MRREQLDQAADLAVQNPYYNPCPVTREGVRQLLENAFEGRRPA
jgi:maleylacetate reductase